MYDIVALGGSRTVRQQMDNFGELLDNSAKISRTISDKDSELADSLR